jgi:hypothetical protein
LLAGEADDSERQELAQITAAITNALKPPVVTIKTVLRVLKLSAFREWLKQVADDSSPNRELLAIAKRNLEQVKAQGVTDAEGMVAVEMPVPETTEDTISKLEARIVELEAEKSWDKRTNIGLRKPKKPGSSEAESGEDEDEGSSPEELPEKQEAQKTPEAKSVAQDLSTEIMDAMIQKFMALKERIAAGPVTAQEIEAAWPGYSAQNLITTVASLFAKYDTVKALFEILKPELEKIAGTVEDTAAKDAKKPEGTDAEPDEEPEVEDTEKKEETQKSSDPKVANFLSGNDLAPRSAGGASDLALVRRGVKKGRQPGSAYR